MKRYAPLYALLAVLVAWELGVRLTGAPRYLIVAPTEIVSYLFTQREALALHAATTALEALLGLLLGCASAVFLGIALHLSRFGRRAVFPLVIGFESLPKVAIVPLLVLWLGFGLKVKVLAAALVCAFPILIATVRGLSSVPAEVGELCRIVKMPALRRLFRIELPYSLPFVFAGARVAASLAVVGAVVGEFVGAQAGLGYLLLTTSWDLSTVAAFASMLLLGVLGLALYGLVVALERWLAGWSAASALSPGGRGAHAPPVAPRASRSPSAS